MTPSNPPTPTPPTGSFPVSPRSTDNLPRVDTKLQTGDIPLVRDGAFTESMNAIGTGAMPPVRGTGTIPPARIRRSSGAGCWLTAFVTLVVAGALILVGLLLPPINLYDRLFAEETAAFSVPNASAARDGLTVAALGEDYGDGYTLAIESQAMDSAMSSTVNRAIAAPPARHALASAVYGMRAGGDAPGALLIALDIPAEAAAPALLDLYGWDDETGAWRFLPARVEGSRVIAETDRLPDQLALFQALPPEQPSVLVAVGVQERLSENAASLATIVSPAGLQPALDGSLTGSLAAGISADAGYWLMPAIRNFSDARAVDPQTPAAIIRNPAARAAHAVQLTAFAASGYDGVVLDYRELPPSLRADFTALIEEAGRELHAAGKRLGVVVPMAIAGTGGVWETGAYDWRAIGAAADYVQITLDADPQTFAPGSPLEAMLAWATREIPRERILLGLTSRSARQVGDEYTAIGFDEAVSALGDVRLQVETTQGGTIPQGETVRARLDGYTARMGADPATGQTTIDYLDDAGEVAARIWLTTPEALRYRMDRAVPFALGGVAFEDLLANGVAPGVYETILAYKMGMPDAAEAPSFGLRWTIAGADGVIDQVTTGLDGELVATIDAPDGNYAVNVEVVSSDQAAAARGGAVVAVFAPTYTPSPIPTATPTVVPTATPPPARVQRVASAGAAPASGAAALSAPAGGAAVAPGSGSIVMGNFEYGGHVFHPDTGAAGAMQRAGMNWMKIQLRYSPGADPGMAAGPIASAHGRGFKILLGMVGYPNDLASGGDAYISQFAQFLGGVAALGPDAIEVWNEPNLDREWPRGQISGVTYASMLRQSYQAIKGANGGVMVISAAPAPTGAEAAFPGQVMNDDNWLREVVNAGGMNFTDCVGAHYNEGIIAPNQRNGDPRDGYYTRFFLGMLDTYVGITGGARPICFTELGYLTPEGFPPLPGYFAWAQNVSVAQQAAWLAEAAAIASQSGRVRLLIVWNVDFTDYGSDPMGGYAIIRPGGGCPACDALAGAR